MDIYKRTITRELPVETPLHLHLVCDNGGVKITGAATSIAVVNATLEVQAATAAEADEAQERVDASITLDGYRLSVGFLAGVSDSWQQLLSLGRRRLKVHYDITVPPETDAYVYLANGPVAVSGLVGPLETETVNGPMGIQDIDQAVTVQRVNGRLDLSHCRSAVSVATVNGPLSVRDSAGPLEVDTTNGPIHLERIAGDVKVKMLNGPLTYEGTISGDFDLGANNGPITLRLPAASRFALDAAAVHGVVESDFEVTEAAPTTGETYRVRLRTENGVIRLLKTGAE